VLMCRVSSLAVSLRDEWKINRSKKTSESFIPTRRLVQQYIKVVMQVWQLTMQVQYLLKQHVQLDIFVSFC
jgi:hypothetical protein